MNSVYGRILSFIFVISNLFIGVLTTNAAGTVSGETRIWHKVTITFDGPDTDEEATYNPFLNYYMEVTFSHSSGSPVINVPGFYAADGNAANTGAIDGNKWRVHFMPTKVGTWDYRVTFYEGPNVAIADNPAGVATDTPTPHNETGSFIVNNSNKSAPDFRHHGLLRYVNNHYLQFAGSGDYFLKNGTDSPENFLGYVDFDGTYDTSCCFLHEYAPHLGDWHTGDPQWSGNRGRSIIGAINYLSTQHVNSVYMLTYNIDDGDGGDTWPWTSHNERNRFDVSKLEQWEIVFSHLTSKGVQLHIITQERENDELLGGSSGLNAIRKLYYRELVARFSHHPVLQWNLGEENDNTTAERLAFAQYIRDLDPYDHPITVHTYTDKIDTYDSLYGSPYFEATSIQGFTTNYNDWASSIRQLSSSAGRPWVVYGDEQPDPILSDMSNLDIVTRNAMWGNLFGGGGGVEWYFGYQDTFGDIQSEDWRLAEPLWQRAELAVDFFRDNLPFWEMEANNNLTTTSSGSSWTFAKTGEIYAIYLMDGAADNPSLDLGISTSSYNIFWFNPITGASLQTGSTLQVTGPGPVSLGTPPSNGNQEWVALVQTGTPSINTPPEFIPISDIVVTEGNTVDTNIEVEDEDASVTITVEVRRDSDNALMDATFYNLIPEADGTTTIEFLPQIGDFGNYTISVFADDGVNPLVEALFTLAVLEIDTVGILITQTDGKTRTSEPDLTDTILVYLNKQPTDTVIINISSSNVAEITTDKTQLIFDAVNWLDPQSITLLGQDDLIGDGYQKVEIILDASSSLDAEYALLPAQILVAVNYDNEEKQNGSSGSDEGESDRSSTGSPNIVRDANMLKIVANSSIIILGSTVEWQISITNVSDQILTNIDAEFVFSSDDVTILNSSASSGQLTSELLSLSRHYPRVLGKPRNSRQAIFQPSLNFLHNEIHPGEIITISVSSRLDTIPLSQEVSLTGQLIVNNNLADEDQVTLPVVVALPQTGESPWWRSYILLFAGLCGFALFGVFYSHRIAKIVSS